MYDDPRIDTHLDGFLLEDRIGHGATGTVYRAKREEPPGTFAIKVLSPDAANLATITRRFEREAKVLRKLRHPGIVRIESFGIQDDAAYIVMEYLEGETLEARLQRAPLSAEHALSTVQQILLALAHAHDHEIAHRDLKPANIFLLGERDSAPDVRVLDFGLAKFLSHDEADTEGTLTRKGRVVGTPAYMAPEQITGVAVDARVDVYSAGIVLFELLADGRPFQQTRRSELLRAHLFEDVPQLSTVRPGARVDSKLEEVLRKALAKDPAKRYDDARAFFEALKGFSGSDVKVANERAKPRSQSGTASVVIEADERSEASSATAEAAKEGKGTESTDPSGKLGKKRKSERPSAPTEANEEDASQANATGKKKNGAKSKGGAAKDDGKGDAAGKWQDARWVGVAVWAVSLLCFFAVVGTMVYSAVVLR